MSFCIDTLCSFLTLLSVELETVSNNRTIFQLPLFRCQIISRFCESRDIIWYTICFANFRIPETHFQFSVDLAEDTLQMVAEYVFVVGGFRLRVLTVLQDNLQSQFLLVREGKDAVPAFRQLKATVDLP